MLAVTVFAVIQFLSCKKNTNEYNSDLNSPERSTDWVSKPEFLITNYGAKGDGKKSCTWVFKKILGMMTADGGTIVIPQGEFRIDTPIVIDKSYVTIRGYNEGIRSNVDIKIDSMLAPSGGSKLLLKNCDTLIVIKRSAASDKRISGLTIKNISLARPTDSIKGVGIAITHNNDGIRISDVVCINLNTGIYANLSDAMIIQNCWISECMKSIFMENGKQNMIANCQLGGIPSPDNTDRNSNNTVLLKNQENFVFNGNHVYPDGDVNLKIENGMMVNVTGNNFQSHYVGMIEVENSMNNLISNNIFWMRNLSVNSEKQLRKKMNDYGVIRINGLNNMVSNNTIFTDWVDASNNPVVVRVWGSQSGNSFQNLKLAFKGSNRLFYVVEGTEIVNCVDTANVKVDGGLESNIRVVY